MAPAPGKRAIAGSIHRIREFELEKVFNIKKFRCGINLKFHRT